MKPAVYTTTKKRCNVNKNLNNRKIGLWYRSTSIIRSNNTLTLMTKEIRTTSTIYTVVQWSTKLMYTSNDFNKVQLRSDVKSQLSWTSSKQRRASSALVKWRGGCPKLLLHQKWQLLSFFYQEVQFFWHIYRLKIWHLFLCNITNDYAEIFYMGSNVQVCKSINPGIAED